MHGIRLEQYIVIVYANIEVVPCYSHDPDLTLTSFSGFLRCHCGWRKRAEVDHALTFLCSSINQTARSGKPVSM